MAIVIVSDNIVQLKVLGVISDSIYFIINLGRHLIHIVLLIGQIIFLSEIIINIILLKNLIISFSSLFLVINSLSLEFHINFLRFKSFFLTAIKYLLLLLLLIVIYFLKDFLILIISILMITLRDSKIIFELFIIIT